jgi:hypothetical protein
MLFENINFIALLAAAVVNMIVGSFWYSPAGFGKLWIKLSKVEMGKNKNMGLMYALTFVGSLMQAFVLSRIIMYAGAADMISGAKIGLLVGLGFLATTSLNNVVFGGKPLKLYYLDLGYYLVVLVINGALLASLM